MKIVRFSYKKEVFWGILKRGSVRVLKDAPYKKIKPGKKRIDLESVKLLPPATPSKIILSGLNYKDHAKELGMKLPEEPVIFLKPPSSLIGHEDDIIYPKAVRRIDYEAELAVVIKKEGKNIPEDKVDEYILGYTCLNDVTARILQQKDIQWTRAKSFDTFCPVGPCVETSLDPSKLKVKAYLNGELKQDSSTSGFIFGVHYLVSFISRVMTLSCGDIISTGTPPGIGEMNPGDTIEVELEGIGKLRNRVVIGL